ncbi:MAG: LPS export ABC transporter periplasmic protein LptC [Methylacidiphilales bacterium]|nr:LPS export ABC transporter periplasmic protein LptC [Candidatus Methylacidiphilales bacterium]
MRPFVLSLSAWCLVLSAAWAQTVSDSGNIPQIPYGQSYKNFEFPMYEGGVLKWKLYATQATGVSLNRAEVTDMKIEGYENGQVTTIITSPKADLYSTERRMRTKNTVRIEQTDRTATAQRCDFDLVTKKYVLTDNVRVVLKNFNAASGLESSGKHASASPTAPAANIRPLSTHANDSLLDSPGAYSNSTNVGPVAPASPTSQ